MVSTKSLVHGEPVANKDGTPTPYLTKQSLLQQTFNEDIGTSVAANASNIEALQNRNLTAGTGLDGGGDLSADRTFDLANTAVTPGTFGDATNSPQITIDAQGRITAAVDVDIEGGVVKSYSANDGDATLEIDDIDFTVADTEWEFSYTFKPNSPGNSILVRVSQDGATYFSGADDYAATWQFSIGTDVSDPDISFMRVSPPDDELSINHFRMRNIGVAGVVKSLVGTGYAEDGTTPRTIVFGGTYIGATGGNKTAAIKGIQFLPGAGTINILELSVYERSLV